MIIFACTLASLCIIVNYAKPVCLFIHDKLNKPEEIPTPDKYCNMRVKKKLNSSDITYYIEYSKDGKRWYEIGKSFATKELAMDTLSKIVENGDIVAEYYPERKQITDGSEKTDN